MKVVYDLRSNRWHVVDVTGGIIERHPDYVAAMAALRRMRGIS